MCFTIGLFTCVAHENNLTLGNCSWANTHSYLLKTWRQVTARTASNYWNLLPSGIIVYINSISFSFFRSRQHSRQGFLEPLDIPGCRANIYKFSYSQTQKLPTSTLNINGISSLNMDNILKIDQILKRSSSDLKLIIEAISCYMKSRNSMKLINRPQRARRYRTQASSGTLMMFWCRYIHTHPRTEHCAKN